MHNKILKSFIILFITLFTISLFSCASKHKVIKERSETFIADIDSFEIGDIPLYASLALANPSAKTFVLDFYPRTNNVTIEGRIAPDAINICFDYAERKKLYEAAQEYIQAYEEGTIKDEKPTKKNALCKGNVPLMWGVLGLGHSLDVNYTANIEYLEPDKPYFRLKFDATDDYSDNSSSPAINIYISPSQWQTLFELCNQEDLEARCDEIIDQAEAF